MRQRTGILILAGLLVGFVAVPLASAKTAKDCIAEWRADKAGMQARGTTEKAYVDQCKEGAAPTAAAPAVTPSAASPKTETGGPSQKTAKDCIAEWRADKAGMQARGTTEKAYVEQCKGGAEPTVAAPIVPKPSATTPAPTTPAPAAQKSAPPQVQHLRHGRLQHRKSLIQNRANLLTKRRRKHVVPEIRSYGPI